MLDQTLVVLGTEFGLTSRINDNDGRDDHVHVPAGRGWEHTPSGENSRTKMQNVLADSTEKLLREKSG